MHYVSAKGILSATNGINVYRGCTHGCIYCDSRSDCYQFDHAFEDVEIKQNAPELLEAALRRKRKRCMIGTGSMCDPYLPIEREERITRRCLELIERYGFGVSVLTKSDLMLRDKDLLAAINKKTKAVACMTLTTYDDALCRILEPNVCPTSRRAEALRELDGAGVYTGVWLGPILPFINDTEENLRGVLDCCFSANVRVIVSFGMGVTLRSGDRQYFYRALDRSFPGLKERYIKTFGDAYQCPSPSAASLWRVLREECSRRGVICGGDEGLRYLSELEVKGAGEQLGLF